jgi:hypothetical protein
MQVAADIFMAFPNASESYTGSLLKDEVLDERGQVCVGSA